MSKHRKDLQPWLDYFQMLRRYEENGYLELHPDKREAYITRVALLTLSQLANAQTVTQALFRYLMQRCAHAEGLEYYDDAMRVNPDGPASDKPAWTTEELSAHARAVTRELADGTFALHIVKEDAPHDLLFTIVLSHPARVWWKPLQPKEHYEIIDYRERPYNVTPKQAPPTPPEK